MSFDPQTATVDQWLERIEALHPSEIELGLDRVKAVAERLDCLQARPARRVLVGVEPALGDEPLVLDRRRREHREALERGEQLRRVPKQLEGLQQPRPRPDVPQEARVARAVLPEDAVLVGLRVLPRLRLVAVHQRGRPLLPRGLGGQPARVPALLVQATLATHVMLTQLKAGETVYQAGELPKTIRVSKTHYEIPNTVFEHSKNQCVRHFLPRFSRLQ